jgi:hypothetical protein
MPPVSVDEGPKSRKRPEKPLGGVRRAGGTGGWAPGLRRCPGARLGARSAGQARPCRWPAAQTAGAPAPTASAARRRQRSPSRRPIGEVSSKQKHESRGAPCPQSAPKAGDQGSSMPGVAMHAGHRGHAEAWHTAHRGSLGRCPRLGPSRAGMRPVVQAALPLRLAARPPESPQDAGIARPSATAAPTGSRTRSSMTDSPGGLSRGCGSTRPPWRAPQGAIMARRRARGW